MKIVKPLGTMHVRCLMKRFGTILLVGTALTCFIGGRLFYGQTGDRTLGNSTEIGAVFAFIGFFVSAAVAAATLKSLRLNGYRLLWVACCVLYPLSIYAGYSSGASATRSAIEADPNQQAMLVRSFEMDHGREPSKEELNDYEKTMIALSGADGGFGAAEAHSVARQFFWGPVFVSVCFYGLLIWKKRKGQVI